MFTGNSGDLRVQFFMANCAHARRRRDVRELQRLGAKKFVQLPSCSRCPNVCRYES
eukprot:jgi/Phyca11/506718/fgenesh2_kg.PHYCAscaffold_21_\